MHKVLKKSENQKMRSGGKENIPIQSRMKMTLAVIIPGPAALIKANNITN